MKKLLSKNQILASEDLEFVDVEMPEWKDEEGNPGVIRLQGLTGEDIVKFTNQTEEEKKNSAVRIIAMCAVDENGEKLFTEEDVNVLKKKNLKAILRLQDAAMKLNGMDKLKDKTKPEETKIKNA